MSAQLGGFQPGGDSATFEILRKSVKKGFSTFQQTRNHHQRVPNSTANSAQSPNNCLTASLPLTAFSSIRPSSPFHKPLLLVPSETPSSPFSSLSATARALQSPCWETTATVDEDDKRGVGGTGGESEREEEGAEEEIAIGTISISVVPPIPNTAVVPPPTAVMEAVPSSRTSSMNATRTPGWSSERCWMATRNVSGTERRVT